MPEPLSSTTAPAPLKPWVLNLMVALFFLTLWQVLLRAQNPGLMTDDSGETATAAWTLGIAHYPGYPLYSLMGRLATLIPIGGVAFRMNLLAAAFTLAAAFFLLNACRHIASRLRGTASDNAAEPKDFPLLLPAALVFAVLSLVFCRSVFAQSLTAKGGIYTFTLMGLAVIVGACLKEGAALKPLGVLYFWSVGMGNHWQTQVFWLVFLALRFRQGGVRWSGRRALMAFSFVLVGLSTYLYLPLRAGFSPALNWDNPCTFGRFLDIVLRRDAPGAETSVRGLAAYLRYTAEYFHVMVWHWWPGFAALVAAGLWFLFRRLPAWAISIAAGYGILVVSIVAASHFDTALSLYLEGVFFVSTQAFPAVLGFTGFLAVVRWVQVRSSKMAIGLSLLLLLAAAGWGVTLVPSLQKSRFTLASDYGVNLLRELPRDSLLLEDSDIAVLPVLYLQNVSGIRRDVAVLPLYLLNSEWGLRQFLKEQDARVLDRSALTNFRSTMELLTDPARFRCSAVFYTYDKPVLENGELNDMATRFDPWGVSLRYGTGKIPPQEVSTNVWNVTREMRLRNYEEARDLPDTEFSHRVYLRNYARPHVMVGSLLLGKGLLYPAIRHYRMALSLLPEMEGIHLNLASHFAGMGYPEMARRYCLRGTRVPNDEAQAFFLLGNIDLKMGRFDEAVADYDRCLGLRPDNPGAVRNRDAALRFRNEPPPEKYLSRRTAEDYLRLGRQFETDGEKELSVEAYATAQELGAAAP